MVGRARGGLQVPVLLFPYRPTDRTRHPRRPVLSLGTVQCCGWRCGPSSGVRGHVGRDYGAREPRRAYPQLPPLPRGAHDSRVRRGCRFQLVQLVCRSAPGRRRGDGECAVLRCLFDIYTWLLTRSLVYRITATRRVPRVCCTCFPRDSRVVSFGFLVLGRSRRHIYVGRRTTLCSLTFGGNSLAILDMMRLW